ncbi:unnamed protein product [[Actinomadura] parvosata subsp. kistnae]|uniref:Uncharacterized protein n=1 Tax=[Actinomadura] parvosata subsp. kistnae TaxID=1909395 RepID=A0A1V0AIA4_9ACTN|nr:hypothetical protein [Nonomuraea sp. ATCC 55076]AQZ69940.1 hypothetical protein BKM31_58375 [Nonomuraea sp. ATCC 55076]SPL90266.1 unnamed protein product [Actinomadura parvosata subsp. kistnae]
MAKPQAPTEPPRKSSKVVPLVVLGVLSVIVVGYCAAVVDDDEVTADCVVQLEDGTYEVVDDDYCDDDGGGGSSYYYGGSRGAYLWYYGGRRVGNRVEGGTTLKPSDVTITSRSGKEIQRGGFGRSWTSGG